MPKPKKVPLYVKQKLRAEAVKGQLAHPDLSRLVAQFFAIAGGEKEVAKMLYDEFIEASAGSLTRQRILDMIIRATIRTGDISSPQEEAGLLSDDDLERELSELIEEAADENPAGNVQGKPRNQTEKDPKATKADP